MPRLKIRPEVQKFAEAMERTLREHDPYKNGWEAMYSDELREKFDEEVREAADAFEESSIGGEIEQAILKREVTDVANICMMIWCNAEKWWFFE